MSSYVFPYPCSRLSVHSHVEWHREQRNVVWLPMLMHWVLNYASRRRKMVYNLMNTRCAENGEPYNSAEDIPAERLSPVSLLSDPLCCEMSFPELAIQCLRELDSYRRGEICTDAYGLELLHRTIMQSDQEAWLWVQQCLGGMVREWLRRHPQRE